MRTMRVLVNNAVLFFIFVSTLILTGCVSHTPAPVVNGWHTETGHNSSYVVQKYDTIYSIAWAFGLDYRDLARVNHLQKPYKLHKGQRLKMAAGRAIAKQREKDYLPPQPVVKPQLVNQTVVPVKQEQPKPVVHYAKVQRWLWPTSGRVLQGFSASRVGNRGINITNQYGTPIRASAGGRVVYAGSGLRGYGKLVIIKHNADFLSAYAHNKQILVKDNQAIKAGQQIATMGRDDAGKVMLHFEIRRNGRPVNPMNYLSYSARRK